MNRVEFRARNGGYKCNKPGDQSGIYVLYSEHLGEVQYLKNQNEFLAGQNRELIEALNKSKKGNGNGRRRKGFKRTVGSRLGAKGIREDRHHPVGT